MVETVPARHLEDLILPVELRKLSASWWLSTTAPICFGRTIEPRNRILLAGPPGNGKTTLAEALADALSTPFMVVRYEAIIGSYLGETASGSVRYSSTARSRHCVLFFDEFDSVGKERGDLHETGEIKRVVSSLLLQIDALQLRSDRDSEQPSRTP